jgi:hypothetical protein
MPNLKSLWDFPPGLATRIPYSLAVAAALAKLHFLAGDMSLWCEARGAPLGFSVGMAAHARLPVEDFNFAIRRISGD